MTIKYEPVFGDQSLFDDAPEDAELAVKDNSGPWFYTGGKGRNTRGKGRITGLLILNGSRIKVAMRRIIKTPTWARADQEAGVLPPVGAKARNPNNFNLEGRIAAVNRCECCFVYDDGSMELLKTDDITPIEMPEEKAARLKDEWLLHAAGFCQPGKIFEGIYNALLSGELKAPAND